MRIHRVTNDVIIYETVDVLIIKLDFGVHRINETT